MGFGETLRQALTAPLARALSAERYASPWADQSHLTQITLESLFKRADASDIIVNRRTAMSVPTIASARHTIAGTISRLPLVASKAGLVVAAQPNLLGQLERGVPRSTTLQWTIEALMFYPRTWWHVTERDSYGWPIWVEWVPQGLAQTDENGVLIAIDDRPVDPRDVIAFDSPLGDGLLKNAERTIRRAIAIERAAAQAEDSPVPVIDLHNTGEKLDKKEIAELVESWREARVKGGIAYTSKSIEAKALGKPTEQLLIEGRNALSLELIRHVHIPAWAASTAIQGGDLTYDNRALRNWELIDLTLAPYETAIAERLSMRDVTPLGWTVAFDNDALTRPDQQTRFTTYSTGKSAGFVTNEMIAAWEGWATVPEEAPAS